MMFRNALFLIPASLLLGLAACDSPEQATAPAEQAPAATADAARDTAEQTVDEKATAEELASVEESVEETVDDTPAADAEAIELQSAAPQAQRTDWQYSEGKHFRRLTSSQGTSSPPDKIEVAEIFWYGCPHCYDFDPILDRWKDQAPADVSFVRIPVVWNPTNQVHARLMYTAEALGILDQVHPEIFNSIHQKNNMVTEDEDIVALFEKFGVSEEEFREAYGSFGVTSALKRAENLTRRYGIRSVPIIVVNGKYVTEGTDIRSFDDLLSVTGELVERERASM